MCRFESYGRAREIDGKEKEKEKERKALHSEAFGNRQKTQRVRHLFFCKISRI